MSEIMSSDLSLHSSAATAPEAAHEHGRTSPAQCLKREAILLAATRIFTRDGIHGASIDLIASEARVSRQTIYNHYQDRDGLLYATAEHASLCFNRHFTQALESFPSNDENLSDRLTDFAASILCHCIHDPYALFLHTLFHNEGIEIPQKIGTLCQHSTISAIQALSSGFKKLTAAGHLDIDDYEMAARQFMALVNADMHICKVTGHEPCDVELITGVRNGVQTFLRAFGRNRLFTHHLS